MSLVSDTSSLTVDGEQLSLSLFPSNDHREWCVSLHGGGPSSRLTTEYLAETFVNHGISFCSFDFSGSGTSSGVLAEASLEKRLNEALAVIDSLGGKVGTVIGSSMGGYLALKVTERRAVERLMLFGPAAYSIQAWALPFGDGFTEELRRPNSFLETDARTLCERFRGTAVVVWGERDEVIPAPVRTLYSQSFTGARTFREIVIPGCPHPVHRWLADRPRERRGLLTELGVLFL